MEVAAAVDERLIEQAAAIGSPAMDAIATKGAWYVNVRSRIDRLRPRLDSMLAAAEDDGIWLMRRGKGGVIAWDEHRQPVVDPPGSARPLRPPESAEQLGAAGVEMAMRWRGGPAKRIYLHGPSWVGSPTSMRPRPLSPAVIDDLQRGAIVSLGPDHSESEASHWPDRNPRSAGATEGL